MTETDISGLFYEFNRFVRRIYEDISKQRQNAILSSLSAHALFTVLFQDPGYRNSPFADVLCVPDAICTAKCYKDIFAFLNSLNGIVSISNMMFLKENSKLQQHFATLLNTNYCCEVEYINFTENESVAKRINTWVELGSKKQTRDLLDSNTLDKETQLALVNALQFNNKWAEPFKASDTTLATFYLNENDTIEAQMMRMKGDVYFKEDDYLDAKILELPFVNNDISLIVILPNKDQDIAELEEKYLCSYDFANIFEDVIKEEVNVSMPKFKIEESADFKRIYNQKGLKNNLIDDETYLFGMVDSDAFLGIDILQKKASIQVNENGTSASSGTILALVPKEPDDEEVTNTPSDGLLIYELNIKSDVSNRFARTLITNKVRNVNKCAKDATFSIVLPETAFISEFIMEIGGKIHKADIKEKEDAKIIYNEALVSGRSAGIVEASTRDSNEFTISVNIEPESVAIFLLTYEEMLQRVHDQYELVLNIRPGQIVENLNVEVNINESRPLKFVQTPTLRSGQEISKNDQHPKPATAIKRPNAKSAIVIFKPDPKQQRRIARYLRTPVFNGFSGQFIVQYDVERDPQGGEILLQDGYFVHFFAPNDLEPLPKHVVFVLDTSSSMDGRKISQLKDAMMSILDEIRRQDIISIVEFNSDVIVWDIKSAKSRVLTDDGDTNFNDFFPALKEFPIFDSTYATDATIGQAKNVVQKIVSGGSTFMIGGLQTALHLVKVQLKKNENTREHYQPIIVFLTDGEPNVGIRSTEEIVETVTRLNFRNNKIPIFSLSFGDGADKKFLRKLSLKNLGFARHIYESADASLQLQAFYRQISSPLLTDIEFKYESEVKEVTKPHFPIYFGGSELIVSGRYNDSSFTATINGYGPKGSITLQSVIERSVSSLERLWAYMTVKQLLEERNHVKDKADLTKKAVDLAIKYSFVTDVTSLVVVKTDPVQASENYEEEVRSKKKVMKKRCIKKRKGTYPEEIEILTVETNPEDIAIETLEDDFLRPPSPLEVPMVSKEFLADHPFIIILKYKRNNQNMILFVGRVCKPCC